MQSQVPGNNPGKSSSSAPGQKKVAERLLSFASPRAVFVVIFAGILVSAALILAAFSTGRGGLAIKSLTSSAGFANSTSSRVIEPVNGKCPLGYKLDPMTRKCISPQPPQPTPPAPTRAQKLDISFSPAIVAPGGSYTLTATYVDANGVSQKYSGLLDVQLRLCQIANPTSCQNSGGAWGDYTLVNGSVLVNLPPTTGEGIYNASFIPRAQTGWDWSSEAVVTVQNTIVPPPAPAPTACSAQGITAVGATATATYPGAPATNAIDGRLDTMWNSGNTAPQSITIDLGQNYNLNGLCLLVAMSPNGQVVHTIEAGVSPDALSAVATINKILQDNQWEQVSANTLARYVKVTTRQSPSWVAWYEIKAFGDLAGGGGGVAVCPSGSVVASPRSITTSGTTTFSVSDARFTTPTFETTNTNVLSISGTKGTGVYPGQATITGRAWVASVGKFCGLSSTTVTVTAAQAEHAAGSITPNATIGICAGRQQSVTVVATITNGTGKIATTGSHTAFAESQNITAGNPWSQVISYGNITGTGVNPSVTVKLLDAAYGNELGSVTIVRDNSCESLGSPRLEVGTVMTPCISSQNGIVTSIAAFSPSGSAHVVANGRSIMFISAGQNATQSMVDLGTQVTDNQSFSFSLVQDGTQTPLVSGITKTVQRNPNCSPTGTITPGSTTLGVCANNQHESVSLTARITTNFGEGTVVLGANGGTYRGSLPSGIVSGVTGNTVTFTVHAADLNNGEGVTFNIKPTGGAAGIYVSGAGAVVYRNDAQACGTTSNASYSANLSGITTAICPTSGQFAVLNANGSVTNGPTGKASNSYLRVQKDGSEVQRWGLYETTPGNYNAQISGNYQPTQTGSYSVQLIFDGQQVATGGPVSVTNNCVAVNPSYDFTVTANDVTFCTATNLVATISFNAIATNMPSGYQTSNADQVVVSKDGQIVYSKGFVNTQAGSFVAVGTYHPTVAGTYYVAMQFNNQAPQNRTIGITQNCPPVALATYSANLSGITTAICPTQGQYAVLSASGSITNAATGKATNSYLRVLRDGSEVQRWGLYETTPGNYNAQISGNYQPTQTGSYSVQLIFDGQQVATSGSVSVTNNCAAPTGTLSVTGGIVPCNSQNGPVNISVSGQAGVQYSIVRSGGWSQNITGSGSTSDIVPLGTTYTYSLSAGSQYLGSKFITGVLETGCGGAGRITADPTTLVLARQPVFPYACGIARQGTVTGSNSGNVNLHFTAGGVTYDVYPGQSRTANTWYTSAGTYTFRLVDDSGRQIDSTPVTVSCVS